MPSLRIATFNCENLLMRCDFAATGTAHLRGQITDVDDTLDAEDVDSVFNVLSQDDRTLTAQALAAAGAEVCALQEIENLVTLTAFDLRYLSLYTRKPYGHRILREGNDTRGIDVALLSHHATPHIQSHARETWGSIGLSPPPGASINDNVFRRDCLEVDIEKEGQVLTLFVCHLKSMHGGRAETASQRRAEAEAVRCLVERRFPDPAEASWVLLGDFNDYFEVDGRALDDHGLGPFIDDGFAIDLLARAIADPQERWTHYYSDGDVYGALDHIFLSPRLARLNPAPEVAVIRAGLAWRATRYQGLRFPGIGFNHPKASDHCPLVADLVF
jgi:endonuclease/exonuclease/phosphatase family metal-dependent hydrolase